MAQTPAETERHFLIAEYGSLREGIHKRAELMHKTVLQAFTASAASIGTVVTVAHAAPSANTLGPQIISWTVLAPYVVLVPLSWQVVSLASGINAVAYYLRVFVEPKLSRLGCDSTQPAHKGWENYLYELRRMQSHTAIRLADVMSRLSYAAALVILATASSLLARNPDWIVATARIPNKGDALVTGVAGVFWMIVLASMIAYWKVSAALGRPDQADSSGA